MNRVRVAIVAATTTIAGLAGVAGAPPASAAEPVAGKQVLDLLCASKGGTPFFTPYTISRCQEARRHKGFEVEQLVCEDLLDGTFRSVPSPGRPNRTNWSCVSNGPTA